MSYKNDETWFIIKDFNGFVESTRGLVFNNFGKHENDDILSFTIDPKDLTEINSILSFEESETIIKSLVKKQNHKISKKSRYVINDTIYLQIISDLNDRMISNILNGLVNKGLVESAYDSESNDFVFWIKKDEENTNKDLPETD